MDSNFTKKQFFPFLVWQLQPCPQQLKKIGATYNILPSAVFEIESSSKGF
jgi:hypothetical protein